MPTKSKSAKPWTTDRTKRGAAKPPIDYGKAIARAFATNERINQLMLAHLDPTAWNAEPPLGIGRTIAAIVSHLHNVRHMWLVVSAKGTGIAIPDKLDRRTLTLAAAQPALAKSGAAMVALLDLAAAAGGHLKEFKPDVVGFIAYAISHEAHHRGQILLLARQLGLPLPKEIGFALWDWRKRDQEVAI